MVALGAAVVGYMIEVVWAVARAARSGRALSKILSMIPCGRRCTDA